jgi:hypothetical protein
MARVAGRGSWPQLARLWLVTLAANLAGGLVMAGMIVIAVPQVRGTAAELGRHYATLGVSWHSLMLAVLAGVVITLLTRMQHASDALGPKITAGVAMSLPAPGSAAVPFGAGFPADVHRFGNLIGGIALVTSIRLLQVPHRIAEERTGR